MGRKRTRTPEIIKQQNDAKHARYLAKNRNNPEWWDNVRARDRRQYAKNPLPKKERVVALTNNNPTKRMLSNAKVRAKKLGLEFNLELSDIFIPEICPMLGIPIFRLPSKVGSRNYFNPHSPSLDRLDNTKGYIKGNVWVVSHRANMLKSNSSLEELELMAAALRKKLKSE